MDESKEVSREKIADLRRQITDIVDKDPSGPLSEFGRLSLRALDLSDNILTHLGEKETRLATLPPGATVTCSACGNPTAASQARRER